MQYFLTRLYAQKKEKIIILLALIISVIFFVQISSGEYSDLLNSGGRFGLEFFYTVMSGGILIWLYILYILIIPNLWASDYLIDNTNKFSNVLKTRFGTSAYIKKSFISNFIFSTLCIFMILLIILLYIHLFLAPINFGNNLSVGMTTDAQTYVSNEFINLIIFILFTSVGYGVFSSFVFSLQLFIKNIFVFRILGVIIGFILYTGPILLANTLSFVPMLQNLISYFFIGYLINPGVMTTSQLLPVNPYVSYLFSVLIYTLITLVFAKIMAKREYLNG